MLQEKTFFFFNETLKNFLKKGFFFYIQYYYKLKTSFTLKKSKNLLDIVYLELKGRLFILNFLVNVSKFKRSH